MTDAEIRDLVLQAGDTTRLARMVETLVLQRAATACEALAIPAYLKDPAYRAACDECALAVLGLQHQAQAAIVAHEHRELLDDAARYRWIREHRPTDQILAVLAFSGTDAEMDDDIDELRGAKRPASAA
jgi:hypothetical protein